MIQLHPTPSVLDIAARLEAAGFETWCVGGAVRDALLGDRPLDWDLATTARPEQVQQLFGRRRTIPVGVEFGTVAVLDEGGVAHEITTFRRDVRTDGRHAVVEFGASLDDDLARRDFTINAIAWRPATRELRDTFHGQADLAARVVRAVGNPDDRMREDRLRALRAIRFAARYRFAIEPATLAAIRASAPHLTRLSAERVQQEIVKTLEQVARPSAAFALWRDTGALPVLVPALAGVSPLVFDTLDRLPRARQGTAPGVRAGRTSTRVAALFLDLPPAAVREALQGLRFSKHDVSWATGLSERWQALGRAMAAALQEGTPPDAVVRRWLAALGRLQGGAFLRVALARWSAMRAAGEAAPSPAAVRALHRRMEAVRLTGALEVADLAIGGDDLRRAGIPAGPIYAKILHALLGQVLDDPARNTPPALLAEVPRIVAALPEAAPTRPPSRLEP
ncbi:MAG: Polynucleotide adenylyltransferase region [Gemmatimonadetes bacterium]|nr:Polynucleotide adenylyltransferase region [Gemmatimonadota bacterium]